ncbi:hypothetical protein [Aquimarina macrocephali]|nr:hypothetical protein [Aquimarina macrocephali]
MKKQKLNFKKLSLEKSTVTELNLRKIVGGARMDEQITNDPTVNWTCHC